MTDVHLRLLRAVAKQRQRDLDDYEAPEHISTASADHKQDLEGAVGRSKVNVTMAEARRRSPLGGAHPVNTHRG